MMDVRCHLRWISSFIVQSGGKLEADAGWRASITVPENTLRRQKTASVSWCKGVRTQKSVLSVRPGLIQRVGSPRLKWRSGVEDNDHCQVIIYQHTASQWNSVHVHIALVCPSETSSDQSDSKKLKTSSFKCRLLNNWNLPFHNWSRYRMKHNCDVETSSL